MLMKINGCIMQLLVASWAAESHIFIVSIGVLLVYQGVNINKHYVASLVIVEERNHYVCNSILLTAWQCLEGCLEIFCFIDFLLM